MKVAIILAEFGKPRPKTANISKYFPEAEIRVYGDGDVPVLFPQSWNQGRNMNNYYKIQKLLICGADVAIAFDADMWIVSEEVRQIIPLTRKFGACLPMNPRLMVKIDTKIGRASDHKLDETQGTAMAWNTTPVSLDLHNPGAVEFMKTYCRMLKANNVRAPLTFWRAAWQTGFSPMILPPQWCVCKEHIGVGNEIILHVGHEDVRRHYKISG